MQVLQLCLLLSVKILFPTEGSEERARHNVHVYFSRQKLQTTSNILKHCHNHQGKQSACLKVANVLFGGHGSNDDDNGGQRNKTHTHTQAKR